MIKGQIARLKRGPAKPGSAEGEAGAGEQDVAKRLDRLEKLLTEMSERLKNIEDRLPPKK